MTRLHDCILAVVSARFGSIWSADFVEWMEAAWQSRSALSESFNFLVTVHSQQDLWRRWLLQCAVCEIQQPSLHFWVSRLYSCEINDQIATQPLSVSFASLRGSTQVSKTFVTQCCVQFKGSKICATQTLCTCKIRDNQQRQPLWIDSVRRCLSMTNKVNGQIIGGV